MSKALLIIDIQNDYFIDGANPLVGSWEAAHKAKLVLEDFRINNLPVVHIRHISVQPNATFFLPDTFGSEIHSIVSPAEGEKVIIKHFPNSFRDTELMRHLQHLQINELVICGMMTHMCVDTTVRAAKDLGFDCTLIGDACATLDLSINNETVKAKEVQNAYLAGMSYFFANVITADQYLGK